MRRTRPTSQKVLLGSCMYVGIGGLWGKAEKISPSDVEIRCLRGVDLSGDVLTIMQTMPTRWVKPELFNKRRLKAGDVVVEGSGALCGRHLLITAEHIDMCHDRLAFSNFCKVLKCAQSAEPAYMAYALRHLYTQGITAQYRRGVGILSIDLDGLLGCEYVSLPPLDEQHRIVAILDSIQDAIRTKRAELDALETLSRGVLAELIG